MRGRLLGDELARQLDAPLHARVGVGVVEEDGGEAPERRGALPADDLVVVELGQLVVERRDLGVLVELGLPAVGDRLRQAGAGDDRHAVGEPARERLGLGVLRPVGAPLDDEVLEVVGGDVELGAHPRPGAAQARDLECGDGHVRDRGARLKAAGDRDHGDAVRARELGQAAAARHDDPPRAEGSRGLVAGERLLGVARVRGAQDGRVGRRPRRQAVGAGREDRARRVVAEHRARQQAADARAAHPRDDQAGGRVPGRAAAPTRPSTSHRGRARAARRCPTAGRTCRPPRSPRHRAAGR